MHNPSVRSQNLPASLMSVWIFIMVNMIFADIFTFMNPEFLQGLSTGYAEQVKITESFLLLAACVTEIPIAMLLLTPRLAPRANRRTQISVAVITILFVIGGGSLTLHYIFFASIEVLACLWIIQAAWRWREHA